MFTPPSNLFHSSAKRQPAALLNLVVASLVVTGCKSKPTSHTEASPDRHPPATQRNNTDTQALQARMNSFLRSIQQRDSVAFLQHFSPKLQWSYRNTILKPNPVQHHSYQELKEGMDASKVDGEYQGYYQLFLDGGDFDCFRDHVEQKPQDWALVGPATFTLRPGEDIAQVFVQWQKTPQGWFVTEIAEPSS